jgi:hypothetical protein
MNIPSSSRWRQTGAYFNIIKATIVGGQPKLIVTMIESMGGATPYELLFERMGGTDQSIITGDIASSDKTVIAIGTPIVVNTNANTTRIFCMAIKGTICTAIE